MLDKKTCTCTVFDKLQLPCSHALVAALHVGVPPNSIGGEWYGIESWKRVCKGDLLPVPEPSDTTISENVTNIKMLPPETS